MVKVGSDGNSGNLVWHQKPENGKNIYNRSFAPLVIRNKSGKVIFKNMKPNSKRLCCYLERSWQKETHETIVKSVDKFEEEVANLKRHVVNINGTDVNVCFEVENTMNDGKTLNALAYKHHKEKGFLHKAQKELSTQSCHLCLGTSKDFKKYHDKKDETVKVDKRKKPLENVDYIELLKYGNAGLHEGLRTREALCNAAFKKRAIEKGISEKEAKEEVLEELDEAIHVKLFRPEPEKKGNSNRGEPLKRVTAQAEVTAPILGCSVQLIKSFHELLSYIESTKLQNITEVGTLAKNCHDLYMTEFGVHEKITIAPTMHRVLHHTEEYMVHFQAKGFSLGELSEQALEATNKDSKRDIVFHGYQGSYEINNLNCFQKSWWVSDYRVVQYCYRNFPK